MKYLVAILTAEQADRLCEALLGAGVDTFTAADVRDYRQHRRLREIYKGAEYVVSHQPRVKVEVAVANEAAERVIALIHAAGAKDAVYVLDGDPARLTSCNADPTRPAAIFAAA
jgi:nitrogen regulatory protein P-II 2